MTQMYADLASRSDSVQQSINQHEAAGELTPEHAATLRQRYSELEQTNSNLGRLTVQSSMWRSRLSAGSGTPIDLESEQRLVNEEVYLATSINSVSQQWDRLSESVALAVSQREALSTIHEELSRQAADVLADIDSIASMTEPSNLRPEFVSALRERYDRLSQANSSLRGTIGTAEDISTRSRNLSQRWSELSERVALADSHAGYPRHQFSSLIQFSATASEPSAAPSAPQQGEDFSREEREAHPDFTEGPGHWLAR